MLVVCAILICLGILWTQRSPLPIDRASDDMPANGHITPVPVRNDTPHPVHIDDTPANGHTTSLPRTVQCESLRKNFESLICRQER